MRGTQNRRFALLKLLSRVIVINVREAFFDGLAAALCCFRQQVRLEFSSLCERAHLHKREMSNAVLDLPLERHSPSHQFVHQIGGRGCAVFAH